MVLAVIKCLYLHGGRNPVSVWSNKTLDLRRNASDIIANDGDSTYFYSSVFE